MLTQQLHDKPGLHQNNRSDKGNWPGIPFPRRRLPKQDFTSRWQAICADVPPLKLAPIEFRPSKIAWWRLDVTGPLPIKDAHRDRDGSTASTECGVHWTTDNFFAEELVLVGQDRCVGSRIEPRQRSISFVRHASRVNYHLIPENRRVWWQRSGLLQYVFV